MGPKILLLLATFCTAEVTSRKTPHEVLLGLKDILEINKKTLGFTESVFLTEITLCGIPNSLKCSGKPWTNQYEEAVNGFFVKTIDATSTLKKELPGIYTVRGENVKKHVNDFGHLIQEYQKQLLGLANNNNNNSEKIKKLMTDHQPRIEDKFIELYFHLYDIKRTTLNFKLPAVSKFETDFEKAIEELKEECNNIVNNIKLCKKKKN